jgi:RNase adaptor protein for sRNA GlmZ degradation
MKLRYIFIFFILIQCSYSQAQKDARYPGDEMRQIGNQLRKKINSINKKLDNALVPGLKQNDIDFDWKNTEEYKMIQIMDRCLVNDDRFVCNPYYKKALKYKETISNKVKRSFYNKNW